MRRQTVQTPQTVTRISAISTTATVLQRREHHHGQARGSAWSSKNLLLQVPDILRATPTTEVDHLGFRTPTNRVRQQLKQFYDAPTHPPLARMITSYLQTLKTTFNPFSTSSKIPRLFLALLPANAHQTLKIKSTPLPRNSTDPSTLELGFKDGKVVKYSWGGAPTAVQGGKTKVKKGTGEKTTLQDIVDEVNRHARVLGRKEELNG